MPETYNFLRESTMREMADALNTIAMAQAGALQPIDDWATVAQLVQQGMGPKAFPVGTTFKATHSVYGDIVFEVMGHDHHPDATGRRKHTMTLAMRDVIYNHPADATEALYYCAEALAAGTYHFSIPSGYDAEHAPSETVQFTLTQAVPEGGVIMFPWANSAQITATKVSTYASREATTAIETGVTVTAGSGGTDLGTADGTTEHMNHIQRARYGSNNWAESAAREWLNSAAAAGEWWTPKTPFDRPASYASAAGFMAGFGADFLAVLGAVDNVTAQNTVYEEGGTTGGSYVTRDTFFNLSMAEVGLGAKNNNVAEGTVLPFYAGAANADRIKYDITAATTARSWWLRSPYPSYANGVRSVNSSGALYLNIANYGYGLAPACIIC